MKPIALYTIGAINIRVFAHYDDVDVRCYFNEFL